MSKDSPKTAEKVTLPTQKHGSGEKDKDSAPTPAPTPGRESRTETQNPAPAPAPDPRPEPAAVNATNTVLANPVPRGGDPNNGTVLDQEKAKAERADAPVDGAGHAIHDGTAGVPVNQTGD